ncbi:MAG: glycosyltransferase family 2 protein [Selenomonadaceae bacterium]|nr:glycosyltransferase family 2 protein [Selenomonadaceae bacterium]
MSQPLLSVCIPTRNRKDYLVKLINEFLAVDDDRIELVVSDNVSDDGTEEVMRSMNNNKIRYSRNTENNGYKNMFETLAKGKGKFRMLIRDKDTIEHIPDFRVILDILESSEDNTTFFGTLTDADGKVWTELCHMQEKNSLSAYLYAVFYTYCGSSYIFSGKVLDNVVKKIRASNNADYLLSTYPQLVLAVYCAQECNGLPMPELNIWFQKQPTPAYYDISMMWGNSEEPYWTITSGKKHYSECIRLFQDISAPLDLKINIFINIIFKYLGFGVGFTFNTIYSPPEGLVRQTPEVLAREQKKTITEWHFHFWDGFYSMAEIVASQYGVSIVNHDVMNAIRRFYNQFCVQTAAREGVRVEIK